MIENIHSKLVRAMRRPFFQYLLLVAITLFAVALRFYKLGEWSFWIDEIYTTERAQALLGNLHNWPSITEALISITFSFLGVNEWSARLAPAIIGAVSIPILYFPIRSLFGQTVALLAGLLLTLSPWHLFWSQNARFYALLLLLYTLALLFFFIGLERDRPWYIFIGMILLTFAVRERLTALFFIPVALSYVIAVKILPFKKPAGLRLKNIALLGLPVIIFGVKEIFSFISDVSINSTDQFANFTASTQHSNIQVILSLFVGNPGPSPMWVLSTIVYNIGVPLICLGLFTGIYLVIKKRREGLLLLIGALVPLLIILILSTFVYSLDRYIFISLSSWIILGAIGIKELFQESKKVSVILALGIAIVFLADPLSEDMLYFKYQNGNRPDWKSAYEFVSQNKLDGDIVFAIRPDLGKYYLDEAVMVMHDADPDVIMGNRNQAWFIDNGWTDPNRQKWIQENSELANVYDVHTPLQTLTMRVYYYAPN